MVRIGSEVFYNMKEKESGKRSHSGSKKEVTSAFLTGLPFEDRLWMFWRNYSRPVILGIVLVVLGFLGYQGVSLYKTSQLEKLQREYRVAVENGKESVFAEANIKEPLAGSVFLATADRFVNEDNYDEAIANYNKALVSLKSSPFGDRAQLGIAFAAWMKGDKDLSKQLLDGILNNNEVMGVIRAEAAYRMALISLSEEDYAQSKEFLNTVSRIPNAGIWGQKAMLLRDSTPGLARQG
ncbi:hypothetical protein AYO37_01040 [Opitutia bacterium SCGC AG-212-L18]|nr:hypothetical protein AYO37_01040 [Opitutae bacterium SCGC AG-212-L18]